MRAHLLAAMVATALLSVALTGLLLTRAAESELQDFSRRDLRFSAVNAAEMAAAVYVEGGGWSARSAAAVREVARSRGDTVALLGLDGRPIAGALPDDRGRAVWAPVRVEGHRVGAIVASHPARQGVAGAAARLDRRLSGRTDDLLVEAGVAAGFLALVVALAVALQFARPLHRLTDVARRMEAGEIETRAAGAGGGREMARLARTMDRLAAALRRQDELRRATAADVTHELRGALVGMVARIEMLQDGVGDERTVLRQMEGDVARLRRLVTDVGSLADAQRPGLLLDKRSVDLAELASARAAACADQFHARRIALTQRLAPARVTGDPERLGQALDNLLSNALRYTDPGGRVTLRAGVRDDDAVVVVADSGIGIAAEHVGRVFDRFWRAPGARERAAEGSGVGLAVVSEVVRAHGGRVEVSSRPGAGTTFTVVMPLAAAAGGLAPAAPDGDAVVVAGAGTALAALAPAPATVAR